MDSVRILIVNADDFGFSPGINAGIIEAHRSGIVTSTSLMVRQPAAAEAAELARSCPDLSVGLHIDLCEWVFEDADWVLSYEVVPMDDPAAVEREVLSQFARFVELTGRQPTHVDSHQHVHRSEPLRSILRHQARAHDLVLRSETPEVRYCGDFYGQSGKGEPYPEGITVQHLCGIIDALPTGVTELGCHPGGTADFDSVYRGERLTELRSLCDPSVKVAVKRKGVELCGFSDAKVRDFVTASR